SGAGSRRTPAAADIRECGCRAARGRGAASKTRHCGRRLGDAAPDAGIARGNIDGRTESSCAEGQRRAEVTFTAARVANGLIRRRGLLVLVLELGRFFE